jgi:hypothetical protein
LSTIFKNILAKLAHNKRYTPRKAAREAIQKARFDRQSPVVSSLSPLPLRLYAFAPLRGICEKIPSLSSFASLKTFAPLRGICEKNSLLIKPLRLSVSAPLRENLR